MSKSRLCNLAQGIVVCGVLISLPLNAQSRKTQAQHLVDLTAQRHPEITGLELSATPAGQERCVTIAADKSEGPGREM